MDVAVEDWQEGRMVAGHERVRAMVGAHLSRIWALLRRLGVPMASLDDAVQQVFLVATRKLDGIDAARERQYLQGIAVRVASDVRRAEKRRDARVVPASPAPPTPDELLDQARARALLDEVLDAMAYDLRVPFVLFELDELTVPQIAEMLHIPEGTASSRLRRAREEFRRLVAERKAAMK